MSNSIFGSQAIKRSPGAWTDQAAVDRRATAEPAAALAPRREVPAGSPRTSPPARSTPRDAALISIIEAPLRLGETALEGFTRKERELRAAIATLGVLEARVLQARLSQPRSGDPLAVAFSRLTADRRARLIHFLADARRREALQR